MPTLRATTVVAVAFVGLPPRAQLRVARGDALLCSYSKEGLKVCSALDLSPAVPKGLGLRRSWRPWGSELVEEQVDAEETGVRRLSMALNPKWILWCVLGHIFLNPRRLRRYYDEQQSGGTPN